MCKRFQPRTNLEEWHTKEKMLGDPLFKPHSFGIQKLVPASLVGGLTYWLVRRWSHLGKNVTTSKIRLLLESTDSGLLLLLFPQG